MSLESTIARIVSEFTTEIVNAVLQASFFELTVLTAAKPKAKPKPQVRAKPKAKVKPRAKAKKKFKWPKCKHKGCKKNSWRRGKGFCGEHAKRK